MRSLLTRFCLGAALLCGAAGVGAVPILDQVQSKRPVPMAAFSLPGLAQSFIQERDNIVGAGIWLFSSISNANMGGRIDIQLYDVLPTAAGVKPLAAGSATGHSGDFVSVLFDDGEVDLIGGHTYFLVFTSSNPQLQIAGDETNPYPRGQVYAADFTSFPTFDYAFATFAEVNGAVPEPGSLALLAIALAGGALARRRSKH